MNIPSASASWIAAMVMRKSIGAIKYGDKGNMTKAEIDKTIAVHDRRQEARRPVPRLLEKLRREREPDGLGRGGDPVDVVARRCRRALERASPANTSRWPRATAPGAAASAWPSTCRGIELDAAYEYINWYLSGWVGAFLNRQGYYTAVLEHREAANMKPRTNGAYWMEGKPATADILSPEGKVMEKAGAVRDGGSFYRPHGPRRLLELGDGPRTATWSRNGTNSSSRLMRERQPAAHILACRRNGTIHTGVTSLADRSGEPSLRAAPWRRGDPGQPHTRRGPLDRHVAPLLAMTSEVVRTSYLQVAPLTARFQRCS